MKIIKNNIIPFKGFKVINLFGILFVRGNVQMNDYDINHEEIHTKQMKEMLYAFFYLWYLVEWIIKVAKYKDIHEAYRDISFEREAYANMYHESYLKNRKHFNWIKLL